MTDFNKRLMEAARGGRTVELKALLRNTGCDARAKDNNGMTALMWAAWAKSETCVWLLLPLSDTSATNRFGLTALMQSASRGHEACVQLLLPESDALAKDNAGYTASFWAQDKGHESLAQFIDAYALSQTERTDIEGAARSGAPSKRPALRV